AARRNHPTETLARPPRVGQTRPTDTPPERDASTSRPILRRENAMPERSDDDVIRQMINVENTVINHRLTWFATLEGLLFSALGFAWGKPDAHALVRVLAVLGMVAALCSLGLIMSA